MSQTTKIESAAKRKGSLLLRLKAASGGFPYFCIYGDQIPIFDSDAHIASL